MPISILFLIILVLMIAFIVKGDVDDENIGAVECSWVIECDCWCDTYDDDDDDDVYDIRCWVYINDIMWL
jgi:hypothetical protein